MLTPKFSLSQDADFVYIVIYVPHIKLSEAECYVSDDEFYFYSKPYYLRLHLPGKIIDNESSSSQYDSDTGRLTVRVSKDTKGETFVGLDMLTKLLIPKRSPKAAEIEVISSEEETTQLCETSITNKETSMNDSRVLCGSLEKHDDNTVLCHSLKEHDENTVLCDSLEEHDELECDWFIEQKVNETTDPLNLQTPQYGFANKKSQILNVLVTEIPEVVDLKDADNVPVCERKVLRKEQESCQFDCEHYLADYFDNEIIKELMSPAYPDLTGIPGEVKELTEREKEKLLQLPRREYILDSSELSFVYLGLIDLMFAYAYDYRLRQGQDNVESEWTVSKLSATLSWLDSFATVKDVLVSCAQRSLIFPLYRNWELFERVLSDVRIIFEVGRSPILKCLLDIHSIFAHSDTRYPLNDLYITDYCVWIQGADPKRIDAIAKALAEIKILKSDLNFQLDEMEADARKLMEDYSSDEDTEKKEPDIDRLACAVSNLVKITETKGSDSDDEDETDDSSSSSATETDSNDEGIDKDDSLVIVS